MSFDRRVVGQRFTAWRASGECDKFRREQSVCAQGRGYIGRQRRNPVIEFHGDNDGVFFIAQFRALGRSEMTHRNHASSRRARVANFRMDFDAGHIFVLDLQCARRFFQTITGKRKRERGEQDDAASDD